MIPPGRKITISMKTTPSVRFQPSPTKSPTKDTTGSAIAGGRKPKKACSECSLKDEKMFSKYLIRPAPSTGPISVPAPPRMVISTTSPEAVHCMRSAPTSGSVAVISAPARPA